jgi:hypothetical protein
MQDLHLASFVIPLKPRTVSLDSYAHFFAGDYVKDSLAGHRGAADADYVYAPLAFNF